MNWIKCSDRLPEIEDYYWTQLSNGAVEFNYFLPDYEPNADFDESKWQCGEETLSEGLIVAWQPMIPPKPFTEAKEG